MNWKKTLIWSGVILLFVLMLITAIVFLLASAPPADYLPYELNHRDRKDAARHFVDNHFIVIGNKIQEVKPFTHAINESDLNMYLAALDEIAFIPDPGGRSEKSRSQKVFRAMDKAGLSKPAVKLADGMLTFMVQTRQMNKVLSLDLKFQFLNDDQMRVELSGIRVGRMPIPQFVIKDSLRMLKREIGNRQRIHPGDLDGIIAGVILAMGDEPVSTTIRIGRKRIRKIRDVEIKDGKITVHIVPVLKEEAAKAG
jgi:hypothetical protein